MKSRCLMSGLVEGGVLKRVILEKVGNILGTLTPKHRGKEGSRANQKTRRGNKIATYGPVCKTSIPGSNPGGASTLRSSSMRRVPTVALAKVGCFCLPESYGWQAKFLQTSALFVRSPHNRNLDCGPKWTQHATRASDARRAMC